MAEEKVLYYFKCSDCGERIPGGCGMVHGEYGTYCPECWDKKAECPQCEGFGDICTVQDDPRTDGALYEICTSCYGTGVEE